MRLSGHGGVSVRRDLRRAIRALGMGYVLAVRANHGLTLGVGRVLTAAGAVKLIPRGAWKRMRTGSGTKGSRQYDWAMLEVTSDDTPGDGRDDGRAVLLRLGAFPGQAASLLPGSPATTRTELSPAGDELLIRP